MSSDKTVRPYFRSLQPGTECTYDRYKVKITSKEPTDIVKPQYQSHGNNELTDVSGDQKLYISNIRDISRSVRMGPPSKDFRSFSGQTNIVRFGLYGKTIDNDDDDRASIEVFVPYKDTQIQAIIKQRSRTGISNATSQDTCTYVVGYLDLDKETNKSLKYLADQNPTFDTILYLSNLAIGTNNNNSAKYTYQENSDMSHLIDPYNQGRKFLFENDHALVQPEHGEHNGFKSTCSLSNDDNTIGFPPMGGNHPKEWSGEIDILKPI